MIAVSASEYIPFLTSFATYIAENYTDSTHRLCVIFPNHHAKAFFLKEFGTQQKQIIAPEVLTMSAFTSQLADRVEPLGISLLLRLYFAYKRYIKTNENFADFYPRGEVLLSDFSEMDSFVLNPHSLFRNLQNLKEIEHEFSHLEEEEKRIIARFFQGFSAEKLSVEQEKFVTLWEKLPLIYTDFNESLDQKGWGYKGGILRRAMEAVRKNPMLLPEYDQILFCGFYDLTPSEKRLMGELQGAGRANFFWDYDEFYLQNGWKIGEPFEKQRHFFREPKEFYFGKEGLSQPKEILIEEMTSYVGQAHAVARYLRRMANSSSSTAVVLPDPVLLPEVLYALPQEVGKIRISMGYPLSIGCATTWITLWWSVWEQATSSPEGEQMFELLGLKRLLSTPLFSPDILSKINQSRPFVSSQQLVKNCPDVQPIFAPYQNVKELGDRLLDLLLLWHSRHYSKDLNEENGLSNADSEVVSAFLVHFQRFMEELKILPQGEISVRLLKKMSDQIIRSTLIPFEDEPQGEVQIIGVQETRLLDFDQVIIPSMNEGDFPPQKTSSSFFSYHIRKAYGLPLPEDFDRVFGYLFWSLLQRARKVVFLYNTQVREGGQAAELSRFLSQLEYLTPQRVERKKDSCLPFIAHVGATPTFLKTEGDVGKAMEEIAQGERKLSASSLKVYIDCPLRFCYDYLLGLRSSDDVSSYNLDSRLMGKIYHKAMEQLYTPFINQDITSDTVERILRDRKHEEAIKQAVNREYGLSSETKWGGTLFITEFVVKDYVRQTLEQDKRCAPLRLVGLEKGYEYVLPLSTGETPVFFGEIDRLDRRDGVLCLIDYKTGKDKRTFKGVQELFTSKSGNPAIFQTLLYSLAEYERREEEVQPGLYLVSELYDKKWDYHLECKEQGTIERYSAIATDFKEGLSNLLSQLFDKNTPFFQTEDKMTCSYCPHKAICLR